MNYHNINHCDFLNGEGIRVSLWVSGCCVHCKGCQNPQTWNFKSGIEFTNNDLEELLNALKQPYIKGLTLTGGNPLDNSYDILFDKSSTKISKVFRLNNLPMGRYVSFKFCFINI